MNRLDQRLSAAIQHYWKTLARQGRRQGKGGKRGAKDRGGRSAVTGGKQLAGIVALVRDVLFECGLPEAAVITRKPVVPGYFRPTKEWDLLVVVEHRLLAAIEFKAQTGPSFGNNFNNRTEEALGSATDINTAYREGAFSPGAKPWLGYLFLLETTPASTTPVRVEEPHFPVFAEFRDASYQQRYEQLCLRMVRERLYDAACFLTTDRARGLTGAYTEPHVELTFRAFITSLTAAILAYIRQRM